MMMMKGFIEEITENFSFTRRRKCRLKNTLYSSSREYIIIVFLILFLTRFLLSIPQRKLIIQA